MTQITACVTVWTVTTDGDNAGIETAVYATEAKARAAIVAALEKKGVARCADGHKLSAATLDELSELWCAAFDGACIIESHTLSAPLAGRVE